MPGLSLTEKGAEELKRAHPAIAEKSFPLLQPGQTVRLLSSGRQLGYLEYVDASLKNENLLTVVLLPGIPGTRLFTHQAIRARGFVPGWRLIVLERPGIGLSDPPPPSYTYTDFAADFREFCALLGLLRVAVIGFSAGTPFATALACVPTAPSTTSGAPSILPPLGPAGASDPPPPPMEPAPAPQPPPGLGPLPKPSPPAPPAPATAEAGPGRVGLGAEGAEGAGVVANANTCAGGAGGLGSSGRDGGGDGGGGGVGVGSAVAIEGVALVSAIGPPDTPNKQRGMALLFQFAYWACAHLPWVVGWVVRSEANAFRRRPVSALKSAFAPYNGKADVAALKRPEVEELLLESALELYSRGQEDSVLRENLMFAARPWGFDLGACHTPVAIWQGGQDRGCTPAMSTHLAAAMGPAWARTTVLPEQGHMLYFDVWEEVVAWVNGLPRKA